MHNSGGGATGDLLNIQDDELGRFEGGKADDDLHDPTVDFGLGGSRGIAFDEVGFVGRFASTGAVVWRGACFE